MKALAMQRSSFTWSSGSVISMILLSVVLVFRLVSFSPPHVHKRASLFPQFRSSAKRFLSEAPSGVSQELKQEGKRQNEQPLWSKSFVAFFLSDQRNSGHSRSLLLPLSYNYRRDSFFPRKLPPSSVTDDPLPS